MQNKNLLLQKTLVEIILITTLALGAITCAAILIPGILSFSKLLFWIMIITAITILIVAFALTPKKPQKNQLNNTLITGLIFITLIPIAYATRNFGIPLQIIILTMIAYIMHVTIRTT